ncbi:MAG: DnaJ domain-containing protein [Chthoniobacterales bacterium]
MRDCFALLDQPRRPWIDLEKLKQAFHRKTLQEHPDARPAGAVAGGAENAFAQINDAYQVLQDPKQRLQHLLQLEGQASASSIDSTPKEAEELFPLVAAALQAAERVVQKRADATNPLSRSLMEAERLQSERGLGEVLLRLSRLRGEADAELQELDGRWFSAGKEERVGQLQRLYLRYAFVTRWIAQLEEKRTQLALQDL